ncbi:MAG: hypothetical protein J0L78_03860 [Planctomycetes bacterium]|nr:hypothetical protein [Planctomycetota bacterium]
MKLAQITATIAVACLATHAIADPCAGKWQPGNGMSGLRGNIATFTIWDSDGPGPLGPWLILAGNGERVAGGFQGLAPSTQMNIVAWDGTNWHNIGVGMPMQITSLAVHQGDLIAAGYGGGSGVMRWNGTSWANVGGTFNNVVNAVHVLNGELYAGGLFSANGSTSLSRIAKWSGTNWQNMAGGMNGEVLALSSFDNSLIAGGAFTVAGGSTLSRIAKWNGSSWSGLGSGLDGSVTTIGHFGGSLIAGGFFSNAGSTSAARIAAWNGTSWSSFGSGLDSAPHCIFEHASSLYVGGGVFSAGGIPIKYLARWDGAWHSVDTGANNTIASLAAYQNELVVGGAFKSIGDTYVNGAAKLVDGIWTPFSGGVPPGNSSLCEVNETLYVISAAPMVLSSTTDGKKFTNIGPRATNSDIRGSAYYQGEFYVSGSCYFSDGSSFNRFGKWNGTNWVSLDSLVGGQVTAIGVHNSKLVVAGTFESIGGVSAHNIALFDGNAWTPLGSGISGSSIFAVASYGGNLYVGGNIYDAGGVSTVGLAYWTGSNWIAGGLLYPSVVVSFAVADNKLLVAGAAIFPDTTQSRVSTWDGTAWAKIGQQQPVGLQIAIEAYNGRVFLSMTNGPTIGGVPCGSLVMWDGNEWQSAGLHPNYSGAVVDLHVYRDELVAVGGIVRENYEYFDGIARYYIRPLCHADFDHDGFVGDSDFTIFVIEYDRLVCSNPAMLPHCPADLNCDEVVDDVDFGIFIAEYNIFVCE